MFYDVLLFIYFLLTYDYSFLKVFVLLNDVHPCFCLRLAVSCRRSAVVKCVEHISTVVLVTI